MNTEQQKPVENSTPNSEEKKWNVIILDDIGDTKREKIFNPDWWNAGNGRHQALLYMIGPGLNLPCTEFDKN